VLVPAAEDGGANPFALAIDPFGGRSQVNWRCC